MYKFVFTVLVFVCACQAQNLFDQMRRNAFVDSASRLNSTIADFNNTLSDLLNVAILRFADVSASSDHHFAAINLTALQEEFNKTARQLADDSIASSTTIQRCYDNAMVNSTLFMQDAERKLLDCRNETTNRIKATNTTVLILVYSSRKYFQEVNQFISNCDAAVDSCDMTKMWGWEVFLNMAYGPVKQLVASDLAATVKDFVQKCGAEVTDRFKQRSAAVHPAERACLNG